MARRNTILWIATTVALASQVVGPVAFAQSWSLEQNDPNPFCPPAMTTWIQFNVAEASQVLLEVWDPSGTEVVRTLLAGVLNAGAHSIVWDGRDDQGVVVPSGDYPYRMTAGEPPLFEDTKVATVTCPTAADASTWGVVKARYRR